MKKLNRIIRQVSLSEIIGLMIISFFVWVVIDEGARSGADTWLVITCAITIALLGFIIMLKTFLR